MAALGTEGGNCTPWELVARESAAVDVTRRHVRAARRDERRQEAVAVRGSASDAAAKPNSAMDELVGTLRYTAPELIVQPGTVYTEFCDVYSFGLLLWEIFHQQIAFGDTPGITVAACLSAHGKRPVLSMPSDCEATVGPLITSCWAHDAKARPTMATCVEHLAPWAAGSRSAQGSK